MPVTINKLGGHKNKDTVQRLLNYMTASPFYVAANCRGLLAVAEATLDYFYCLGFQRFYAVHGGSNDDSGYWHLHFAINTVSFRDGKRLYETYSVTSGLRNHLALQFDELQ